MKYTPIFLLLSTLTYSGLGNAAAFWVDKNVAQDTDPTKNTYVTMLWPAEFGDRSRGAYLCRENDRSDGTTNVGKAIVVKGQPLSTAVCYIPWRGKEYKRTNNFDLLRVISRAPVPPGWKQFSWTYGNDPFNTSWPSIDLNLDSYGFSWISNAAPPLYACLDKRTSTLGKLIYPHPGFPNPTCFVPMGGVEHQVTGMDYMILSDQPSPPFQ